jgi:hypothetical protein
MADQFAQALLGKAEAPYRGGGGRSVASAKRRDQADLASYDADGVVAETAATTDTTETAETDGDGAAAVDDTEPDDTEEEQADDADPVEGDDDATDTDIVDAATVVDDARSRSTSASDVDPVTRADVAESALRFDDAVELGTREAVIEELRSRIESLPELSQAMLRHYRREGVSDPVAAHIDAGGDGDSGHAYSRHRPIRRAGIIRHAGRGQYAYAVPDLIREAYADRLDAESVGEIVRAVETAFVPPAARRTPEDAERPETDANLDSDTAAVAGESSGSSGSSGSSANSGSGGENDSHADDGAEEGQRGSGLSDAARRVAERGYGGE